MGRGRGHRREFLGRTIGDGCKAAHGADRVRYRLTAAPSAESKVMLLNTGTGSGTGSGTRMRIAATFQFSHPRIRALRVCHHVDEADKCQAPPVDIAEASWKNSGIGRRGQTLVQVAEHLNAATNPVTLESAAARRSEWRTITISWQPRGKSCAKAMPSSQAYKFCRSGLDPVCIEDEHARLPIVELCQCAAEAAFLLRRLRSAGSGAGRSTRPEQHPGRDRRDQSASRIGAKSAAARHCDLCARCTRQISDYRMPPSSGPDNKRSSPTRRSA